MTWYLTDLARFKTEREGLESLGASVEWLTPLGLRVDEKMRVIFDADIAIGDRIYPIALRYPALFPSTPAYVFPRDGSRWSGHQFGAGGELCLEYRPDNWTSDITGAQLIESAYRLLEGENPLSGEVGVVPSAHRETPGQRLRVESFRLLITSELDRFLRAAEVGVALRGNALGCYRKPSGAVYLIEKITLPDGEIWQDKAIPAFLSFEVFERQVSILRIAPEVKVPAVTNFEDFKAGCAALGLPPDARMIVLVQESRVHAFLVLDDAAFELAPIAAQPPAQRLDAPHDLLKAKSVALIGCGSLGSKVGTMLARSGVSDFLLIDDDLLLPDNFVRNDLDWRDAGWHKVDALARRLQYVNPLVSTRVRRIQLAGQESSGTAEAALNQLVECDLIIDATANPDAINLLSAVLSGARKPMIWAEVFGGGIGGLIARFRPGLEPPPQLMRRAIENWFGERNAPPVRVTRDYGTGAKGAPLIADDADVTAIAAPTARMAIDTLIGRDPSHFPYAVYAIGLAPGSVFAEAFQTFPIDVGTALPQEEKAMLSTEEAATEFAAIVRLFEPK